MPMEVANRLFNCARCQAQVIICHHCDRGQLYCGAECSSLARQASCKAAACRYQKTVQGKHYHAKRQQHYRERQRKKVTHHGSTQKASHTHFEDVKSLQNKRENGLRGDNRCHFCHQHPTPFLRRDFLRDYPRSSTDIVVPPALGP